MANPTGEASEQEAVVMCALKDGSISSFDLALKLWPQESLSLIHI